VDITFKCFNISCVLGNRVLINEVLFTQFDILIIVLSNILLGCYSWYQCKSFENILNILGLLGCELIDWLFVVVFELNVVKV